MTNATRSRGRAEEGMRRAGVAALFGKAGGGSGGWRRAEAAQLLAGDGGLTAAFFGAGSGFVINTLVGRGGRMRGVRRVKMKTG